MDTQKKILTTFAYAQSRQVQTVMFSDKFRKKNLRTTSLMNRLPSPDSFTDDKIFRMHSKKNRRPPFGIFYWNTALQLIFSF